MASDKDTGWQLVQAENGSPYYERRIGEVSGMVQRVILNGYPCFIYKAGIEEYQVVGYKDTLQAAKIAATKYLRWYALRAKDFKRSKAKLRLSWERAGIESVEAFFGHAWNEGADRKVVDGIVWERRDSRTWVSGAWTIVQSNEGTWTLIHPDGYRQQIYRDTRYAVMDEAAYWIKLYLKK